MKPTTFRTFLQSTTSDISLLKEDANSIIAHFKPQEQLVSRFAAATFLVDFSNQKYLYMEDSVFDISGYPAEHFLENGLEASLSKWHPSDLELVNNKVWPDTLSFFNTVPVEHYPEFIVSFNYRMRNAKEEYINLLQRFTFIAGKQPALPAGVIGVAFDINHYKTDQSIVHTIERVISKDGRNANELMFKKVHPIFDNIKDALTGREIQILKLIAEGWSSKQIADKLFVSENTIVNHRKNMLAKTGCLSSSGLVAFALKHGLL